MSGRGDTARQLESKDTNVGLSQRVCIIYETCLNSLNRPQEGAFQCDRALRAGPAVRILHQTVVQHQNLARKQVR